MQSKARPWVFAGIAAVVVAVLILFGASQRRHDEAQQQEVQRIGADWQQRGLMTQQDYAYLRATAADAVRTRAISDQQLHWLLDRMRQSPNAIVHDRVMGIFRALKNPPAAQKQAIKAAITPFLQSRNVLEHTAALKVQKILHLAG